MTPELHQEVTDLNASIWWETSVSDHEDAIVTFQGKQKIAVNHHIEFEGLLPDTEYPFLFNGKEMSFHTLPAKKRIDITKAPYSIQPGRICTEMLQKALDDCDENSAVFLPRGVYLSGALNLHSHSSLYLEEGAVLQGTDVPADYEPRILSRFEGIERMCYRSLLNLGELDHSSGPNCTDVLIYGKGEIRGGGFPLAEKCAAIEKENLKDYLASHPEETAACENSSTIPFRCRGRLINISNCDTVRITGLTLGYGPAWNIHMIYSRNIVTDHCVIQSDGVWNGDGWDPDSSENCILYACTFHTGDDAAAIKSGKNPEGNIICRPSRHIRIFDCVSLYGHGICIGSEMSGGIEDVVIANCDLGHSECGIEIKATKKRGGYVRNISVISCVTSRIQIHSVSFNDDGTAAKKIPVLEKFDYRNVRILGRYYDAHHAWHDCPAFTVQGFDANHRIKACVFHHVTAESSEKIIENADCIFTA